MIGVIEMIEMIEVVKTIDQETDQGLVIIKLKESNHRQTHVHLPGINMKNIQDKK